MNGLFGGDTHLFRTYVEGRKKRVLPWQLSIVDCFFISNAFAACASSDTSLSLARISDGGKQVEVAVIRDAYDLYSVDRDADGYEVVLTQPESGATCYWDVHERFVILTGPDDFMWRACPFPDDIERHRFVEAMECSSQMEQDESAELVYDQVKNS